MRQTFIAITRSMLALVGVVMTTLSAVIFTTLFFVESLGTTPGLYTGIISYLIIPALFILGLALIPIGVALQRRKERRTGKVEAAPVIDLNRPETRRTVVVVAVLTLVNVIIVAVGTYKGVVVMDSTEFCGGACHSVMSPEYTVYKRSPHSRVECTKCHIGDGASWFVKSKLSGSWQMIAVMLDLYPRPIPAPIESLRPARETCEQCHWPEKFVGERLHVYTHYGDDEQQTERKTVLLMNIGGMQNGHAKGIHWHVDPRNKVQYRSTPNRRVIGEVQLTRADGGTESYSWADAPLDGGALTELRTMDCVDCHNRPTHVYETPMREVEGAMTAGRIDKTLPWIKREGLRLIQLEYPSHAKAKEEITKGLLAFYEKDYPELAKNERPRLEAAANELVTIYTTNVFPEMKIKWGTYPNFKNDEVGCFRCHDNQHLSKNGEKKISKNCSLCHEMLATDEENPEILEELHP